jgi:hypothetical protein
MKTNLKVVERPKLEYEAETVYIDYLKYAPRQRIHTEAELDAEWTKRQSEADRRRRPVLPPSKPVRKSAKALQMELFKTDHDVVFESDMFLEAFSHKFDKESKRVQVKVVLTLDAPPDEFHNIFQPIFKLKSRDLDVLIAGTKITAKDLG